MSKEPTQKEDTRSVIRRVMAEQEAGSGEQVSASPSRVDSDSGDSSVEREKEAAWKQFEEQKTKQSGETEAKASPKVEEELIVAPGDLDDDAKKTFETLPIEHKRFISKRYHDLRSDYSRKTTELANERKAIEAIKSAVDEGTLNELQREGVGLHDLVRRSVAWRKLERQDPREAARQYLEAVGVDLSELAEDHTPRAQSQLPPELMSELMESRKFREQFARQQEAEKLESANSNVASWMKDKPLFRDPGTAAEIEAEMVPIVKALKQENPTAQPADLLERAYNYVANGNPRFRQVLEQADKRRQLEQQTASATRARAGSDLVGGPGGSPTTKPRGLRAIIEAAMDGRL